MEASVLEASIFTAFIGFVIMGARYLIRESLVKLYCGCTHEFNEHWISPRGFRELPDYPKGNPCKKCGCKGFNGNIKDRRNTGTPKFW